MTTYETLINRLPEIIIALGTLTTAVTGLLAAYWSYKAHQQSTANGVSISTVDSNVETLKTLAK